MDIAINTTVAALALDRTRVVLMQFSASGLSNGPVSGDHYAKLGIQGIEGQSVQDHDLGHTPYAVRRRNQARIFRWYYQKLAELIQALKDVPDRSGSLFDSTMIVTASEFGMYDHRSNDIPYIVASGRGRGHSAFSGARGLLPEGNVLPGPVIDQTEVLSGVLLRYSCGLCNFGGVAPRRQQPRPSAATPEAFRPGENRSRAGTFERTDQWTDCLHN